ncbi:MAG TPA: c-type cytochrome [Methylothermaceae bacterium]|nr:c-type cytochrome [Methylothermaceae bacterium]
MRKIISLILAFGLTPVMANPLDLADSHRGEVLFQTHCAACHGPDGRGVVPGTPDFTRDRQRFAKGWDQVFQRVRDGFQSPGSPMAMPPRGGAELEDEEIWDILAFLKQRFYPGD